MMNTAKTSKLGNVKPHPKTDPLTQEQNNGNQLVREQIVGMRFLKL